jgi:hypothetical protein
MTPYDYYVIAKRIAKHLLKAGYEDWNNRILDALASGSTSGEIFADLGCLLTEMRDSSIQLPQHIRKEISDLLFKIDEALKQ